MSEHPVPEADALLAEMHCDVQRWKSSIQDAKPALRDVKPVPSTPLSRRLWDMWGEVGTGVGFQPGAVRQAMIGATLVCWALAVIFAIVGIHDSSQILP